HPVHLALHAVNLVLPVALMSHSSAPNGESENAEPKRPPNHEAKNDQCDPGGFSEGVKLRGDRHHCRPLVNVNNIYIASPVRCPSQEDVKNKWGAAGPAASPAKKKKSPSAARTFLRGIGRSAALCRWAIEPEPAQIDQYRRFQQFFRLHRQSAPRSISASE